VRLLNEMSPEERRWHERGKQRCPDCRRSSRVLIARTVSTVIWHSREPQRLPPRRFVHARVRVIEETWQCPTCPEPALLMDFEHVGHPKEIVEVDEERGTQRRFRWTQAEGA